MKTHRKLDDRLVYAFRRVLCRAPIAAEIMLLHRAFEKQYAIYKDDVEAAKAFVSVGAAPRDKTLDISVHAALAAVCLGIMNLDEALTRE